MSLIASNCRILNSVNLHTFSHFAYSEMNNEYYRISCKILQQIGNSVSEFDRIVSLERKEFKKKTFRILFKILL
jgi:hypothetical protein